MNPFTVFDIVGSRDMTKVSDLDGAIRSGNLVESDLALVYIILTETDKNSVFSSLSSDNDGITSEEAKSLHRVGVEDGNTVII